MNHNHCKISFFLQFFGCLVLAIWSQVATAQKIENVVIQGNAKFAAGQTIRLIAFDDFVSFRPVVVASDEIDKTGNFKLTYLTREIRLVQITINTSKAEFYVEPEKTYHLTVDMDTQLFQLLDPMEYGGFLQIRNTDTTSKSDINFKINHFEYVMDRLSTYCLTDEPNKVKFDTVAKILDQRFSFRYAPNDFYQSYMYYSYASLERIFIQKNIDSLYRKYLDNEYILYNNPAYMSFFNQFYDNYLYTSSYIQQQDLIDCINEQGNYLSLFNVVGKDPHLVNEKIRELVIIQNSIELYDNKDFNKKNIISILQEIAQSTHFTEHRAIALNAIYTIQHLRAGAEVPTPDFRAENGTHFKLDKIKDQWIYIQFFNTACEDCIREMMIIKELHKKYEDKMVFVSVSLDFNLNLFVQFKDYYRQFDWQFAHFNNQFDWLNEMQITTLPDNILIGPDGKLARRYAPDISRDLPLFLLQLFKEEEKPVNPLSPHNKN